ncbi:MAG: hypothetical protein ACYTG3_05630 [Planctomycetota bacterium]
MSLRRLALLALGIVVSGCTILRDELGTRIPWGESSFQEGATHYRDVMKELGCPLKVARYGDGVVFLYEYVYLKEGQLGISYDGERWGTPVIDFAEWIQLTFGRASADREALVMIFDRDGILQTERFTAWDQKLGTGFSVQLLIDVGSVVDTSSVRSAADPNDWGAMMLRPLPQTLNTCQSIDDGRFGIEQRGTPDTVGQRALEMHRPPLTTEIPLIGDD